VLAAPLALAALAGCTSATNAASTNTPTTTTQPATTATPATTTTVPVTTTTQSATTTIVAVTTTTAKPAPTTTTLPPNIVKVPVSKVTIKAVGGSSGPDTVVLQQRLLQLGFWNNDVGGSYGFTTIQAVMAFQKYLGLKRTGYVDATTAAFMQNLVERPHGASNNSTLVEVDKTKQLLFLVNNGKTVWVFNTSTGSGIPYTAQNQKDPTKTEKGDAVTPAGLFQTSRERPVGWWEGDLGKIYRPKYFHGGIAIHGMTSIPAYPASHGCVRLSTMAMDFIWDKNLIPLHTPVWVHL
jgi:peptidoglycan hydrolase-like protein with peptidoglycan-binding domain